MPTLTWDAFMRGLKQGTVAPACYFTGPEDLLKDDAVHAVIDRVLDPGLRDFNLDVASAATLDAEAVETRCSQLPMMADRRVVVIRDLEQWRANARGKKALLAYLDHPAPETILLLLQGGADDEPDEAIAARTTHVTCPRFPVDKAVKWALHKAQQQGLALPDDAARFLVEAVETEQGVDLGALLTEVTKLAALPADVAITAELVGSLVGIRHGETPNDWLAAVLADDTPRALTLLEPVLAGTGGVRLVMLLGTALCGVQLARALHDNPQRRGTVARALVDVFRARRLYGFGSWDAAAERWAEAATRWPPRRLDRALRAVLDADVRLKQTTLDDDAGILRTLVLRLAPAAATERAA